MLMIPSTMLKAVFYIEINRFYGCFISVSAVKTRLRSYRTMFRRTFKEMPSGSSLEVATISSPKKSLLKMLWFLKDHLKIQPTVSNLPPNTVSIQLKSANIIPFRKIGHTCAKLSILIIRMCQFIIDCCVDPRLL